MTLSATQERLLNIIETYVRRSPAGVLISGGIALMLGGPTLAIKLVFSKKNSDDEYVIGEVSTTDAEWWINATCLALGAVLVLVGLYFAWLLFHDQRRKRVVAIELRGLNQTLDAPMQNAIPSRVLGRREPIFIDVRQMVDGTERLRREAVSAVNLIPQRLKQLKDGCDRDDLILYAGGLAPVPLLFLAGNLLAAESEIHWLDWNRKTLKWVPPSSGTDVPPIQTVDYTPATKTEAVLAVSISYPVDVSELKTAFPGIPIVKMQIDGAFPGLVVSDASIQQIMQDFMQTLARLQATGIRKIHLVLAAPSVLSMRLGTSYAGRNMPELVVYQYQRALTENPYPWGVEMPNSERNAGEFVSRQPN
ncbi:SAVED domain-containing protein [Pseudomonas baltica]|uniref:SAVED domain-containing protein n=1 Tax=Pseudomonas baltica TaxID=2762576 RepID=UPI002898299F|nr:SAVED domain-containing protein [Pseudomonas baltica]